MTMTVTTPPTTNNNTTITTPASKLDFTKLTLRIINIITGGCLALTGFCGLGMTLAGDTHGILFNVRITAAILLSLSGIAISTLEIFEDIILLPFKHRIPSTFMKLANTPIIRALFFFMEAALCATIQMIGIGSAVGAVIAGLANYIILCSIQRRNTMQSVGIPEFGSQSSCWKVFNTSNQEHRMLSSIEPPTSKHRELNRDNNQETYAVSVEMSASAHNQNNNFKIVISEDHLYELNTYKVAKNTASLNRDDDTRDICSPLEMSSEMLVRPIEKSEPSPRSQTGMFSPASRDVDSHASVNERSSESSISEDGDQRPQWQLVSDETGEYWYEPNTGKTSWTNPIGEEHQ